MAQDYGVLVYQGSTKPGIQRDGTDLDAQRFNDGQWVRFVREPGRPKKMGGYRAISQYMTGPIRNIFVWSRQFLNAIYSFSSTNVEVLSSDQNGVGSSIQDRTPVTRTLVFTDSATGTWTQGLGVTGGTLHGGVYPTGTIAKLTGTGPYTATIVYSNGTAFVAADVITASNGATGAVTSYTVTTFTGGVDYNWQVESMYDAAANSYKSIIVAHAAPNLSSIDDGTLTSIFVGDIANFSLPLEDTGQTVSGGVVFAPPYLISYGTDGQVTWCNANEPLNITTGDATTTRATAAKIVKGLPLRSGQGTSALLWSLDSVIRLAWVGGTAVFRIDTLSSQSSILSSNSVIEYDGVYFWVGIDRFLTYNGTVREVPNTVNLQWFFDNLNYAQRQKVFAIKVPRYGEIWWFFPFGNATECTNAIIYNVRLDTWYDTVIDRSCGYYSQMFRFPVMVESNVRITTSLMVLSGVTGTFTVGDTATGGTSHAFGQIVRVQGSNLYLVNTSGTFTNGETVTGAISGSGTMPAQPTSVGLYTIWAHEQGQDQVIGDNETAIYSFFETCDFGYPTGSTQEQLAGPDRWTRIDRVEPDFLGSGAMNCYVTGKEFAQAPNLISQAYPFDMSTQKIDMREQRREIRLKFESNVAGGDYEMGKVIMHIEMGDVRN